MLAKVTSVLASIPILLSLNSINFTDNATEMELQDYSIYYDVHDLGEDTEEYSTYGIHMGRSNQICISDRVKTEAERDRVLYHEIGHAIDKKLDGNYGKYSDNEEFIKNCFNKEKYSLQGESEEYFFTDTPREFFAESYAIYVLDRDGLQKNGSNTYEFFDKLIKERNVSVTKMDIASYKKQLFDSRIGTPASIPFYQLKYSKSRSKNHKKF